ncbi:ABC transporter ATP-binding protein [Streptomyces pseudovenezuelae]|uniref:ABC transporter ATP-binding protein n=1 Tax=Streptomyces pseudovenezuelae TaxID=67350 RepID=UPI002E821CB6|nr:ABC transporter ATP-binding protein [Streptomyces pseudovenezuelae]WUA85902.1 ABC transporter ATP-binding protein/permease [Streptomyces pseudovenezuelae]
MLTSLLRPHVRSRLIPLTLLLALQLTQTLAALCLPALNAHLVDGGVVTADTGQILRTGAWMVLATVVQMTGSAGAVWLGARTAMAIGRDVRSAVFDRVLSCSEDEVSRIGVPSLLTRTTNDVQQIQQFCLTACTMLVAAPLMCLGGIVMALRQDVALSGLLAVVAPLLGLIVGRVVSRARPLFRGLQGHLDLTSRILREQVTGVRVIRSFVRDTYEQRRFDEANAELLGAALRSGRVMAVLLPTVMLVVNVSGVAVVWIGGHRIDDGTLRVGALTAYLTYLTQVLTSVMTVGSLFVMFPRAEVSAERIHEVFDAGAGRVRPVRHPGAPPPRSGRLELLAVGFRYPGAEEPVLRNVTLTVRQGEVVAVTGSAGSGKSTLLGLMVRRFDPTDGVVRLADADVCTLGRGDLAAAIGFAPQRPHLFSGTVASNLRYAKPDASDEELWRALRVACADAFVADSPEGLQTPVLQGGSNFSGGQRQRLAIARALVHRPDVCLLDDPFSGLDHTTEARLRTALAGEPMTTVIVTQRVPAMRAADRVVVLDRGRLVGIGGHTDLMDTCPTYREIVSTEATREVA